jgi:hypothetical protein
MQSTAPRSASPCNVASPLLIRMNPFVRRDFPLFRQPDHPNRRLVPARTARSATKRCLQLPNWRLKRPSNRIQRQARSCLTSGAFDLQPAITAVEALTYRWGRLSWAAITFHSDRPCFGLGSIRGAEGLPCVLACRFGAHIRAHDPPAPDGVTFFRAHGGPLQRHQSL